MAIVVDKNQKNFEIPEEGLYKAVLGDVIDLGEVDTQYGKKHKVRFVYFLSEVDSEGRQFRIFQQLNVSLHEKATLYKVVRRLNGGEPETPFDLETLIGKQCQLDINNTESEGRTYANVVSVLNPVKGQAVKVPSDFVRFSEQKKEKSATKSAPKTNSAPRTATGVAITPQADDSDTINL